MTCNVFKMAEYVISQLLDAGFTVQRYDSLSTKSIYLKLDYGLSNSIRISDHRGLKQYRYRYNLLSDRKGIRKHSNSGVDRFYYGFDVAHTMLQDIKDSRAEKVLMYGRDNYIYYMENNELVNSGRKGFWAKSHKVKI